MPMLVVGITGGLGTGKSLVTSLLRECGAVTFSADEAARAALDPALTTLRAIARVFGADALKADGSLDRAYLASVVFASEIARRQLEQITHPPILRLLRAQIEACRRDFPPSVIVAVEVPLLFEAKMQNWFERIVVVSASQTVQVTRLAVRNGLTAAEAQKRIAAQMPLELKEAQADVVIRNEGTPEQLRRTIENLWRQWTAEAENQP